MSSLYEINQKILACVQDGENIVDTETGEVLDPAALDALEMQRDEKISNICKYVLNLRAEAKAIREREIAMADRRRAKENKANALEKYVDSNLHGEKFETPEFKASYRKSQAVEVKDFMLVPDCYLIPQEPKVDKALIKKELKKGEAVPGCVLVERNNLSIK